MKKTFIGIILTFACLIACNFFSCTSNSTDREPIDIRVDSVLSLMTIEEKIGQMTLFTSDWDQTGPTIRLNYENDIKEGRTGAIFNAHTSEYNKKLQKIAIEETRLGIPLIFGYDVVHGYKTIFPIPLGASASWDLPAIERSARIAAVEATSAGLHWTFAPMVDIARDPRWGRILEGAGEDTYLGQKIAEAQVRGFQGTDISAENTMVACVKHYAAYGAAQAGRDYHTVDMSDRMLRETYLPPFRAALDAGARTFMTSFNELNGVPASGNKYLLKDILRDEWGFDGFVVTDYTSINEMVNHGIIADEKEAGELALNAGVDMDMQGSVYYNYLQKSLSEGKVTEEQINTAVQNILRIKFELGLFDDPYRYSDLDREKSQVLAPDHLAFAREFAAKTIVLLKNDKGNLPLSKNKKTIALIGPLADNKNDIMASWRAAGNAEDCVTLLKGIENKIGGTANIIYSKGCNIDDQDETGFSHAIQSANKSDVVILAIGEGEWMTGEAACRTDLGLPGVQLDLVKKIIATGKPVIIVLMNGRPLILPWVYENTDAILETWFTGTQGGNAIADVIFGDYNPSAKLTVSIPRNFGQIPIFYNVKNTGRPRTDDSKYSSRYLDVPNSPQFPFGYGLSYTSFEYGNIEVSKSEFSKSDALEISVEVKNVGDYDGEEIIQLYVQDLVGSVTRPVKELKDFKKIMIKKGERVTVSFSLSNKDFSFYTKDMSFRSEPGDFKIFVGTNSETKNFVKVRLKD